MPRRPARVAGLGTLDAARAPARRRGRPRDRPPRRLLPAAPQLGVGPLPRLDLDWALEAPLELLGRAAADRALRGRQRGRPADDPCARGRPRRRRARPRAPQASPAGARAREPARAQPRRPLGSGRVPDGRCGRAGGDDARASTRISSSTPACSTGTPRRSGCGRSRSDSTGAARSASRAKARTSRSGSRAERASSRRASATCPTERSSTARSRTVPRA